MVDEPFIINKQWIDDTDGRNVPHAWNPGTREWYPIPLNGGPLRDQIDAVQGTAASVEELTGSVVIPQWTAGRDVTNPITMSLWVAPFACRITWCALVFDYLNVAASDTNYLDVNIRHIPDPGVGHVTTKTTKATGGEAITARTAWDFSAAAWNQIDFAQNDLLALEFIPNGSPTVQLPVTFTFRYQPL